MKKICLTLLGIGLISVAVAQEKLPTVIPASVNKPVAGQPVINKSIASEGVIQQANKFSLPENTQLSVELLDNCWNIRQNKTNQKLIANYLLTEPKVPQDYEIAWKTARLVYFIGNFGVGEKRFVDSKEGVKLFNYGAKAGKIAYTLQPKKVEGYYWYAIDLGSYGLAKGILSAVVNAPDGMEALKKANAIDPTYQWYGSSRILGRYYQELPRFYHGSNKKALEMFKEATAKGGEFDNNWLFLGRFYLATKDYTNALTSCTKAFDLPAVDGKAETARYKREAKECMVKAKSKLED